MGMRTRLYNNTVVLPTVAIARQTSRSVPQPVAVGTDDTNEVKLNASIACLFGDHRVGRVAPAMSSCLRHPKLERVLARQDRTHAICVRLREVSQAWVEIHRDRLASFHVNTLKAKQGLQRDAILPSTRRLQKA